MANENEVSKPENMIPPGHYTVKAIYRDAKDLVFGEASGGQKSVQVGVTFEITQGEFKGRKYPWYGSFAEGEATRITLDALEAAGVTHYEDDDLRKPVGLGSTECTAVIQHRTLQKYEDGQLVDVLDNDGRPRAIAQIQYINPIGARMKNTLDAGATASFADLMKGTLAQRREKKGVASSGVPKDANGNPLF